MSPSATSRETDFRRGIPLFVIPAARNASPAEGTVYETAESIQETTSLLPDYAFKDSESAAGTSFSGIVGAFIVAALSAVFCYAFKFFRRNTETKTA